jgi:hypothetical protein
LAAARAKTGVDESVLTGKDRIRGRHVRGPGRPRRHEPAALANAGINRLLPQRLAKYRNLGGIQPMLPRC